MTYLLKEKSFDCRVSSVLNKDVRSYGKKFLYDDCDETCWNSDSGTPQWILIDFKEECKLTALEIQFQGGFAGKDCHLEAGSNFKDLSVVQCFYPEDTNKLQRFELEKEAVAKTFKLSFQESTDFFGRIIVYRLALIS
ncbi:nuclear receptor 2C2-associated protein [Venturia canescens]|uniref:nuclear receptor 2C2-associated protein n=1 Tax=Venturia canescens TaxID=32260 RepID=UPI001C9CBA54|nr:nuclear receptor 2C2-associated protein [Venturia canescens]